MHDLSEKWMEYVQPMLSVLFAAEQNSWHHLMTGDTSWFS
jgi:hypothetical protein